MRIITIIAFFSLLLSGGNAFLYAAKPINGINKSNAHFFLFKENSKLLIDQNIIIIEESEIDLEDDCQVSNNSDNNNTTKKIANKNLFFNNFSPTISLPLVINWQVQYHKDFELSFQDSLPIYLFQGVLRI